MNEIMTNSNRDIIDAAIHKMVSAEHFAGGSIVTIPTIYPSGAYATIEVIKHDSFFQITDRGQGWQEAGLCNASRQYKQEAQRTAEAAGITFDGQDMTIGRVREDALHGAIAVVANCSQEAANHAVLKHAEKSKNDSKEVLYSRLITIFGEKSVAKDVSLIGASNHKWHISVQVSGPKKLSLFEPVTNKYNSIVSTTAKFYDLQGLENCPNRVAIVESREGLGDFYGVIAAASTQVLEANVPNVKFEDIIAA